jgi:hypothetical protein
MRKIKKTDRTQNKLDQLFQKKLRNHEVTPPGFLWDNIDGQLNEYREKSKFDHWYYIILVLLIPFAVANILIKYNFTGFTNKSYQKISWLYNFDDTENKNSNSTVEYQQVKINSYSSDKSLQNNNQYITSEQIFNHNESYGKKIAHHQNVSLKNDFQSISENLFSDENKYFDSRKTSNTDNLNEKANNSEINSEFITNRGIKFTTVDSLNEKDVIKQYYAGKVDNLTERKLRNIKGIFFGVDVRMNNSWFLIKESALTGFINNDVQYNFNYGITYALSFGYNFSKNAGIEIESAFSRQGQSYVDNSSRKVPIEGDINLSYFQVPVLIKYKWSRVAAITQNPASFNILIGLRKLIKQLYPKTN